MSEGRKRRLVFKARHLAMSLAVGVVLGVGGLLFVQSYNPPDEEPLDSASVVFARIVEQNELVSASLDYSIVEKVEDVNRLFDAFDIPFTEKSFWYRYNGTIKAGVSLEGADYSVDGTSITVVLSSPYIISNTPDMDRSGVLEENNNAFNPIHVEDVDEFQRACQERSEAEAVSGGLLDEARANAENNIRQLFIVALGDAYTVDFIWREGA